MSAVAIQSFGRHSSRITFAWALLTVLAGAEVVVRQDIETTQQTPLVCSADMPIVAEGKGVLLRAWIGSRSGKPTEYRWTVDAGHINGEGPEVQWTFSGVSSSTKPHKAVLTVTNSSGASASCSLEVFVSEAERGGRTTGRSFLVSGKKEIAGYGLYSYLLLGSRPTDSSRKLYLQAIQAYLRGMEEVESLRDYVAAAKLNVAYLPIETAAPREVTPEWLLEHYDYARSRVLLQVLPGDLNDGPYIVSTLRPLDPSSRPSAYLFQNLSTVPSEPSDLISWWIREFLHQAAQERFWEPKIGELLVLKMRTTIAVLAIGLPEVQKSLTGWIAWMH